MNLPGMSGRPKWSFCTGVFLLALCGIAITGNAVDAGVQAQFGPSGLSSLTFEGSELLADGEVRVLSVVTADRYRNRNSESDAQMYLPDDRNFRQAGVVPQEKFFDADSNRLTHLFEWGELTFDYRASGNRLDIEVTARNTSDDVIEHLVIDLMVLDLAGEVNTRLATSIQGRSRSNCNVEGPDLWQADHEDGRIIFASMRPDEPLHQRLVKRNNGYAVNVEAGHASGGREVYDMVWDVRPIRPGGEDRYEMSLRFGEPGANAFELGRDVFERYGEAFPMITHWPDRRPITAMHLADGRRTAENPRGWKMGAPVPRDWDIANEDYIETFHAALMRGADNAIAVARRLGAQGLIVWQVEGQQYPGQAYYGEPRIIRHVAPEMHAAADDYFKKLRDAGLRVGITIRPVIAFPEDADGKVVAWENMTRIRNRGWVGNIPEVLADTYEPAEAHCMLTRLHNKISYARERWDATLFYLDANMGWRFRTRGEKFGDMRSMQISVEVIEELQRRHPEVLIVPEHQSFRHWASGMQYVQPRRWGLYTGADVRMAYPDAMSMIAVVDETAFINHWEENQAAIQHGDTLLVHGWFSNRRHLIITDRLFSIASLQAPFKVYVGQEGLEFEEETLADARAFGEALAQRIGDDFAFQQRRVYVGYSPDVDYVAAVIPVLEAVKSSGGVLIWCRELSVEQLEALAAQFEEE